MPGPQITSTTPKPVPGVPLPPPGTPTKAFDTSKNVDPKDPEYAALSPKFKTAVNEARAYASKHFAGMSPKPTVLVVPSASNGHQPVTVIAPANVKGPLTVHTHYHGDAAGSVSGQNSAADEIARRVKAGGNTVYVLPEAAVVSRTLGTDTGWGNVGNINETTREALGAAGLAGHGVGRTVISGHSSGGRAIRDGMNKGQAIKADELVLQDALYDGNGNGLGPYDQLRKHLPGSGIKMVTIVTSGSHARALDAVSATLARDLLAAGKDVVQLAGPQDHLKASEVLEAPRPGPPLTHERKNVPNVRWSHEDSYAR